MNYGGGNKLTISSLENTNNPYNFGNSQAQSRAYRDEMKESRGSRRSGKDELDKLVDNKWQMSTVKEDITKEIEQLLKQKDSNNYKGSQVSQGNKNAISRVSLHYEGPALGTLSTYP